MINGGGANQLTGVLLYWIEMVYRGREAPPVFQAIGGFLQALGMDDSSIRSPFSMAASVPSGQAMAFDYWSSTSQDWSLGQSIA